MNYTVVSKRKIAKLISEGIVKGMFRFYKYCTCVTCIM